MAKDKVKQGSKVKVEYTGKFDDGTVFDSSEKHGQALEFEIGKGMIIKGFESAVMEMKVGDEKDIKLEPKDAYGDVNPEMVKEVPKAQIPTEGLKEGLTLVMKLPDGNQIPATIKEIGEEKVTIDLNHPLAGKTLNFNLKLVEIKND